MNRAITLVLGAAGLTALAACGSVGSNSTTSIRTSAPAAAPRAAPSSASAPKTVDGNITIAPAGSMTPGPMKVTPVYCGKFTAAQQSQYGTTAAGGFVYKFTNISNTTAAAPSVEVDFTSASTVVGSNVSGTLTPVLQGQTGTAEVDALGQSGQDLAFSGCQVMSYSLQTDAGAVPGNYAG
jgi:hypothetical protein